MKHSSKQIFYWIKFGFLSVGSAPWQSSQLYFLALSGVTKKNINLLTAADVFVW